MLFAEPSRSMQITIRASMDLEAGAIDAPPISASQIIRSLPEAAAMWFWTNNLSTRQHGIGFKKGNDELKDTVEKTLLGNGRRRNLYGNRREVCRRRSVRQRMPGK